MPAKQEQLEAIEKRFTTIQEKTIKLETVRTELASKEPVSKENRDSLNISIGLIDNNLEAIKKDLQKLTAATSTSPRSADEDKASSEMKKLSKRVDRLTTLICNNFEKERKKQSSLISENGLELYQQMAAIGQMFAGGQHSPAIASPTFQGSNSMNDMMAIWMFATMMNKVNTPTTGYIGRNYLEIFGATNYQDYRNATEREMVGFGDLQNGPYRLSLDMQNRQVASGYAPVPYGPQSINHNYYGTVNMGNGTQYNQPYGPWNYNDNFSVRQNPNFNFQFSPLSGPQQLR